MMKRKLKTRQFKSNGGYTAGGYSGSKTSTQSSKTSNPNQQNTTISVDDRFTSDLELKAEQEKQAADREAQTPQNILRGAVSGSSDMSLDYNNDGRITSADALAKTKASLYS